MSFKDQTVRRLGRRLGYHVVKADYYSPIPDLEDLQPEDWRTERPAEMPGVDLRLDAGIEYLRVLEPYIREYSPPDHAPGTKHGYYRHSFYPALDGEVLYAIVRDRKPSRIAEIGAGFSTLVIRDALSVNGAEGHECDHRVFDPFPSDVLNGQVKVSPTPAQEVPVEVFDQLSGGDVLFIDTTHTVKPGSEVVRLLLEIVPRLASGVAVHIHDVFRPFEYPRFLGEKLGVYWQEHYLVQAFLAFNEAFRVLMANHALSRLRTAEVEALVPRLPRPAGSALWLTRV